MYRAEKSTRELSYKMDIDDLKTLLICICTCIIFPLVGVIYLKLALKVKRETEREFCEEIMNKLMGDEYSGFYPE